jgi:hypothetical protein
MDRKHRNPNSSSNPVDSSELFIELVREARELLNFTCGSTMSESPQIVAAVAEERLRARQRDNAELAIASAEFTRAVMEDLSRVARRAG